VQVAVTADASAAEVMVIAQQLGIDADTDVVRVQRSQAQLQQIVDDVISRIGEDANVAIGIDSAANVVTVGVAPGLTGFPTIADDLVRQYGDAIRIQSPVSANPAQTSFDPPMRGGVKMYHSTSSETTYCTTGFFAHGKGSSHPPYIISAGHCVTDADDSGVWTADFANGTAHGFTNGGSYKVNAGGDMSALLMTNVKTWKPRPWIVVHKGPSTSFHPRYGITAHASSHVGMRVCHTGISSGTHCGTIQKLDVPITYDGKTIVGHQVQTGMCGKSGDSGGPVFANHKAFGTYSATGASSCVSYFEPIGQIESQLGVEVAHCILRGGTASDAGECCSHEASPSHSPDFVICR
jgi:streptogrisin B